MSIVSKGISTIITAILILLIVAGLAGVSYMFVFGVFASASGGIEITDIFCENGEVNIVVRNMGEREITRIEAEQNSPSDDITALVWEGVLEGGDTLNYRDFCSGEGSRKCSYKISGGTRRLNCYTHCYDKSNLLVLSLHFDEFSGGVTPDSSDYGNDGEEGTPPRNPTWVDGKFQKAFFFDGVNDEIKIYEESGETSLDISGDITIEAWIRAQGASPSMAIADKYAEEGWGDPAGDSEAGWELWLSDGKLRLDLWNKNPLGAGNVHGFAEGTTDLRDDSWHHVLATYDHTNGVIEIYVDGELEDSTLYSDGIWPVPESDMYTLYIGIRCDICSGAVAHAFMGYIDEVKIYSGTT